MPKGVAIKIAATETAIVPRTIGSRLNLCSPLCGAGCHDGSKRNFWIPICRNAGMDSMSKKAAIKAAINPEAIAEAFRLASSIRSVRHWDKILLPNDILNLV